MTVIPLERRRASEFARVLDEGARTSDDPALCELLEVVDALTPAALAGPVPATEFRESLRRRLIAVAAVTPAPIGRDADAPAPSRRPFVVLSVWRRRLVAAGAGAVLLLGGVGGVAAASGDALPGEVFYPVKRTVEDVRLALAGTEAERGRQQLLLAETRLTEIERLTGTRAAEPEVVTLLDQTFGSWRESTGAAQELLTDAYQHQGDSTALNDLQTFTVEQRSRLTRLQQQLPEPLKARPLAGLAVLADIDDQVSSLLGVEAPTPEELPSGLPTTAHLPLGTPSAGTTPDGEAPERPSPHSGATGGLPSTTSKGTGSPTERPGGGLGGLLPESTRTPDRLDLDVPQLLPHSEPRIDVGGERNRDDKGREREEEPFELTIPPILPGLPGIDLGLPD